MALLITLYFKGERIILKSPKKQRMIKMVRELACITIGREAERGGFTA